MLLSANHIRNGRPHLEDHPTTGGWLNGPQSPQGSIQILGDSSHFSVEQGHAFACAECLAVPPSRITDFLCYFLIDVNFCNLHNPASQHQPITTTTSFL